MNSGVSIHLLALNEAPLLERLLPYLCRYLPVVVADTGSSDATPRVVAGVEGASLIHVPWRADFGAMRNEALARHTTPWILALDADEWPETPLLEWTLRMTRPDRCVPWDGARFLRVNRVGEAWGPVEWHVRLFRASVRYQGALHEMPVDGRWVDAPATGRILHYKTEARQQMQNARYARWGEPCS
jgi:glycosyltransferase involved in cell wall biosynthesis